MPVSVLCCFCISGFPAIKSAPKIPEKLYKKLASRKLPESPRRGGPPQGLLKGPWRGPTLGRAGHPPGCPVAPWCPLWPYFYPRGGNPEARPLYSRRNSELRRHRHQVSGGQNSCAGTLRFTASFTLEISSLD